MRHGFGRVLVACLALSSALTALGVGVGLCRAVNGMGVAVGDESGDPDEAGRRIAAGVDFADDCVRFGALGFATAMLVALALRARQGSVKAEALVDESARRS